MLIEVTSQTYRSLIPIVPWLQFLVDTEHGGGTLFAYILCGTYIIFKATQLYGKTQELRNAVSSFRLDVVSLHSNIAFFVCGQFLFQSQFRFSRFTGINRIACIRDSVLKCFAFFFSCACAELRKRADASGSVRTRQLLSHLSGQAHRSCQTILLGTS